MHDFAPYLAQISRDVDAVYALFLGRTALQFMRQYQEYGLKARVPLIGAGTTTDEHVLPVMGDEALGVVTALHYSAALDTPANRKFAPAYRARYKKVPSYYSESMYTGGKWIVAAIEALQGRVEDREALLTALRNAKPTDLPARAGRARRVRQPDRERLHQAGRAGERRAAEHGHRHVSARLAVLEIQPGRYLKQPLTPRYVPPSSGAFLITTGRSVRAGIASEACRDGHQSDGPLDVTHGFAASPSSTSPGISAASRR